MNYQLDFSVYQYPFKQPLKTHHGIWKIREGIIVRLSDIRGRMGRGEIAPISWFGSETLTEAWQFCQQLRLPVSPMDIFSIPDALPACQFGFESALTDLETDLETDKEIAIASPSLAYLLPAGQRVLSAWKAFSYPEKLTFKWKIGVYPCKEELSLFQQLMQQLPDTVQLRLDANGGLSLDEAKRWLEKTEKYSNIEFLEQPLPADSWQDMLWLKQDYGTPLALDESVSTLEKMATCYRQGWQGIYVIKAAIAGSPQRLRKFCKENAIDAVFSSVFETEIGRKAALQLANELASPNRALGFGVESVPLQRNCFEEHKKAKSSQGIQRKRLFP